jgi:hypothetical protein
MKKKAGFSCSIFLIGLLAVASLGFGVLPSAGIYRPSENTHKAHSSANPSLIDNWIDFHLTFKKGTNSETRDLVFRTIKKLIQDSVIKFRATPGNSNFSLSVAIVNNIEDSLSYGIVGIPMTATAPIRDPACTCARKCGVCGHIIDPDNLPPGSGIDAAAINALKSIEAIIDGSGFNFSK